MKYNKVSKDKRINQGTSRFPRDLERPQKRNHDGVSGNEEKKQRPIVIDLTTREDSNDNLDGKNDKRVVPLNPMVFFARFSHITEQIFAHLDNKSLSNCREVKKSWQKFIDENNIVWIRIVNIPSVPKNGNTFLHIATRTGQIGITELILSEDCEVNPKNNAGQS